MTIIPVPAPQNQPALYLMEISPYVPALTATTTIYLATQDYASAPTDSPANQLYSGDMKNSLLYSIDLFQSVSGGGTPAGAVLSSVNGGQGGGTSGRGGIILRNAGDQYSTDVLWPGPYDVWRQAPNLSYRFQGAPAVLYQGVVGQTKAQMTKIWSGRSYDLVWADSGNEITIEVSSSLDRLNKNFPLAQYAGTGGAEGGADLTGKFKPIGLGLVRETSPPLLNTLGIYQVTDGSKSGAVTTWLGFFSQGAVIDAGPWTDYATYALLAAAAVAAGKVATCSAQGYFRLGSAPVAPITCDFQVGNTAASGAANMAATIFGTYGGLTPVTDYSTTAIAALQAAQPAVCGYWTDVDAPNMLEALDAILGGIGAYYAELSTGIISVGRLTAPTITGPSDANCRLSITEVDITENGLVLRGSPEPPTQIICNGHKFHTTQTNGLAGTLSTTRIADLAQEYRTYSTPINGTVTTQWPLAIPTTVDTLMDVLADYTAEGTRLGTLYQTQRDIFDVPIAAASLPVNLGDQVWLTHSRYSLQAGQAFIVVGIAQDAEAQTMTLTLWG